MIGPITDFTWSGSGGMETNWFRSLSFTNKEIEFPDSVRRRVIAIGN